MNPVYRFLPLIRIVASGACLLLASALAMAEPVVRVLALFPGRAMLEIDGRQQMLKAGEPGRAGVRLISSNHQAAELEIDGNHLRLGLSETIGGSYAKPEKPAVRIWPDAQGMYLVDGKINQSSVHFLVDTGATDIAMSAIQAQQLGIDYLKEGVPVGVHTASATERGYRLTLDLVSLGQVEARRVSAIVFEGGYPVVPLLGMSFLSRVEMFREGAAMVVRSR
ncbi:MAG: TIGR02281 family clan AA aspartic protease [Gammaproteobacteria bacterium]|nr:TIGR02281 family clan AA aspartic protease [Gammaproteobacteria bacterium]